MLNTKDIKTGGGGTTPKTLQPGNTKLTILRVELEDFKFKPDALNMLLHCEGEDMGSDFEGFFIDKNNESLGRHKGQVGRIKAGEWAFADGTTKSGIAVSRDQDILKFLKNLCIELDCVKWLDDQDGKHATIQSLVTQFNTDAPFKGKWMNVCIAGKEYLNKEGYPAYELFFPKFSKNGIPFEIAGKEKSRVQQFNEKEHIRKKNVENVQKFEGGEGGDSPAVNSSFKL